LLGFSFGKNCGQTKRRKEGSICFARESAVETGEQMKALKGSP